MKRVVLLIDPQATRRFATAEDLRGAGFIVTEAADGTRAMQRMGALLPHIIVLEMELPGMSGRDLLATMAHDPKLARIPVIALTSASEGDRPSGVRALLHEPHDPQELVHDLRDALGTAAV
jgi:two-component system, cell cycle response regulator DivK